MQERFRDAKDVQTFLSNPNALLQLSSPICHMGNLTNNSLRSGSIVEVQPHCCSRGSETKFSFDAVAY